MLGTSLIIGMLPEHGPSNLAPSQECYLLRRRIVTRKNGVLMEQKHIYKI